MITVVIPYYQREPGILAKALASIAAQNDCKIPVHVIVVDDASPAPAAAELLQFNSQGLYTLQLITQPNGGPGAARNTGLDNAPASTRFVAFLDSDDEWMQDHLARAVAALSSGYDFYFADHFQLGQTTSAFVRAGRIQVDDHPTLPNLPAGLHAYNGDLLDQIIRGNIIGTSTVVYDFLRFPIQRFKVEFTNAGEDYLFWMQLAHEGAKVAFSSHGAATYGRGVNVYSGAGWGTDQHLLRIHNELKFRRTVIKQFPLSKAQHVHMLTGIRALRVGFIRDLIHRVTHGKKLPLKIMVAHFWIDPWTYLISPVTGFRLLVGKLRGLI
jgi:succinoglycan biosynthesis protein ExoW